MDKKSFKSKIKHYSNKIQNIESIYEKEELLVSFDKLKSKEKTISELLYFKSDEENFEKKGLFLFGNNSFIKHLKDNEFKEKLGFEHLNYQIYNSYFKLKKQSKLNFGISINSIVDDICLDSEDILYKNKILKRILSLVNYYNWEMKRDEKAIDSNYFITIPEHLSKPKQRFNVDISIIIQNNEEYLFFVNGKGDLCFTFKNLDEFTKTDVENVMNIFKKEFKIKKIEFY